MTAYAITDVISIANFPAVQQITGSVNVTGITLSASFPSSMTVSQGVGNSSDPWYIATTGSLQVSSTPSPVPTANVTVFTASFVNAVLLAPNVARKTAIFTNDDWSSGSIYVKFATAASTGSYSVKLPPGGYYELPCTYSGEIDGVWDTSIGTLLITEFNG